MNSNNIIRAAVAAFAMCAMPGVAAAQGWTPGSELVGQPLQVTTNGVTNMIYLDQGGAARIMTPAGNTIPGNWTAANGQLCLNNGVAQECWPYNAPFQAGQPLTLASSCAGTSTWLAQAVNGAVPTPTPGAERGGQ